MIEIITAVVAGTVTIVGQSLRAWVKRRETEARERLWAGIRDIEAARVAHAEAMLAEVEADRLRCADCVERSGLPLMEEKLGEVIKWEHTLKADPECRPVYGDWCEENGMPERAAQLKKDVGENR